MASEGTVYIIHGVLTMVTAQEAVVTEEVHPKAEIQ